MFDGHQSISLTEFYFATNWFSFNHKDIWTVREIDYLFIRLYIGIYYIYSKDKKSMRVTDECILCDIFSRFDNVLMNSPSSAHYRTTKNVTQLTEMHQR